MLLVHWQVFLQLPWQREPVSGNPTDCPFLPLAKRPGICIHGYVCMYIFVYAMTGLICFWHSYDFSLQSALVCACIDAGVHVPAMHVCAHVWVCLDRTCLFPAQTQKISLSFTLQSALMHVYNVCMHEYICACLCMYILLYLCIWFTVCLCAFYVFLARIYCVENENVYVLLYVSMSFMWLQYILPFKMTTPSVRIHRSRPFYYERHIYTYTHINACINGVIHYLQP